MTGCWEAVTDGARPAPGCCAGSARWPWSPRCGRCCSPSIAGATTIAGCTATAPPADYCPLWRSSPAMNRDDAVYCRAAAARRDGPTPAPGAPSAKPNRTGWPRSAWKASTGCASTTARPCRGYLKRTMARGTKRSCWRTGRHCTSTCSRSIAGSIDSRHLYMSSVFLTSHTPPVRSRHGFPEESDQPDAPARRRRFQLTS